MSKSDSTAPPGNPPEAPAKRQRRTRRPLKLAPVIPLRKGEQSPTDKLLNSLLEIAGLVRSGELRGLAFIGIMRDSQVRRGITGYARECPEVTIGLLEILKQDLLDISPHNDHWLKK